MTMRSACSLLCISKGSRLETWLDQYLGSRSNMDGAEISEALKSKSLCELSAVVKGHCKNVESLEF